MKTIRLDNASEFTSQTFTDYCMSVGINIEHPVAHVHTQNGLAKSLIKRLQLIARLLLMKTKLPTYLGTCYYACCKFGLYSINSLP